MLNLKILQYFNKTQHTMTSLQLAPAANKRNFRMNSIRESLKQLTLTSFNSKIQNKILRKIKNEGSSPSFEKQSDQTQSDSDVSSPEHVTVPSSRLFRQRYRLLEKLGSGGNACVYKCQDKLTNKFYAVKKMKVYEEQAQEMKQNFQNIAALNHPQICKYQELCFDKQLQVSFTVMEYCPYLSLASYRVKNERELMEIVKSILQGIQYLHQNGVSHRDIKPQNILYDQKNGKVKIVDFQISKKTVSEGIKRDLLTITGSNYYFAPQILLGGGYDQRVDLWCLGVTIYKLVTGYTPFESEYYAQTIQNILKGETKFSEKKWGIYSPQTKDFVDKLLKRKEQRMNLNQCMEHPWLFQTNL